MLSKINDQGFRSSGILWFDDSASREQHLYGNKEPSHLFHSLKDSQGKLAPLDCDQVVVDGRGSLLGFEVVVAAFKAINFSDCLFMARGF